MKKNKFEGKIIILFYKRLKSVHFDENPKNYDILKHD